jgi:hypothetical protein
VGNYNYPTTGIRPHAVTSTVLGTTTTSYAYDANGNMTTRAGRTITYSSFNKPTSIGGASGTTGSQRVTGSGLAFCLPHF